MESLDWERVVGNGHVYFPEIVKAKVPGGWLYAATNWDIQKDSPTNWSLTFVPCKD